MTRPVPGFEPDRARALPAEAGYPNGPRLTLNGPAIADAALPGFDLGSWVMFAAPSETPAPIVERFAAEVDRAMRRDDVRQRLATVGALSACSTVADAQRFHLAELANWQRVVHVAGARVE